MYYNFLSNKIITKKDVTKKLHYVEIQNEDEINEDTFIQLIKNYLDNGIIESFEIKLNKGFIVDSIELSYHSNNNNKDIEPYSMYTVTNKRGSHINSRCESISNRAIVLTSKFFNFIDSLDCFFITADDWHIVLTNVNYIACIEEIRHDDNFAKKTEVFIWFYALASSFDCGFTLCFYNDINTFKCLGHNVHILYKKFGADTASEIVRYLKKAGLYKYKYLEKLPEEERLMLEVL